MSSGLFPIFCKVLATKFARMPRFYILGKNDMVSPSYPTKKWPTQSANKPLPVTDDSRCRENLMLLTICDTKQEVADSQT